jgi:hypothetical protein
MSYFTANLTDEEEEVRAELARQDAKWGEQNHPDGTDAIYASQADELRCTVRGAADLGTLSWRLILLEEVFEALAEEDPEKLLGELLQVEAVTRQWRMAIRRRPAPPDAGGLQ